MARSRYVYILSDSLGPKAAFTVKHELVTFLKRAPELLGMEVYRLNDGTFWDGKRHTLPPDGFISYAADFLAAHG